ncbi:hypothetical protein I4U23_000720 [Adineta vaga]|nr:hypothetical protein I4U23_000720 [Adineta vaga]
MCMNKALPETANYTLTSFDDNEIIAFGPIKVKPRKKPAPTLATGRRSKYEILNPDEEQKRNIRRARNRAAAERVRISRLTVEQQLLNEIHALEDKQVKLSQDVQKLQHNKLHLETRLFTHERMCSNMNQSNVSLTSDIDLTTYFPTDNVQSTSQQFDTILYDKTGDLDFESLLESLTSDQIQQNFPESLLTQMHIDDLNDLLMI